jgi:hypothetical protein
MRERLKRAVLKTAVPETVPGVRIPLPPPLSQACRESAVTRTQWVSENLLYLAPELLLPLLEIVLLELLASQMAAITLEAKASTT